ncbi:DUF268 domain-containing protein [Bradyrhizobium genosp. L]|uniref:DUF268 domain-containing protein n=1 Tax=Bradyrhizobium genosp. L TaxID=83637 RepID=UPI0018A33AD2|nr:DUF268 domain-containing protein [Bradyrhizobium genosp. L]QPF87114.1 DUF268 domain-containing protein [Bradyrhizobium genosp. L]
MDSSVGTAQQGAASVGEAPRQSLFEAVGRLLLAVGLDPRRLRLLVKYPRYIVDYRKFKARGGRVAKIYPVLIDFAAQAGSVRGHYFHQDLLVASLVFQANPVRHIDIGSRVDGFVAHVAAFRSIEVMDIRALDDTGHPNISFLQADLMQLRAEYTESADSISCLHALEHFGLGRYGDDIDPAGHIAGFRNILKMLKTGGTLYISFPIGRSSQVHFNSQRVFTPLEVLGWIDSDVKLELMRFDFVDDDGVLHTKVNIHEADIDVRYGCGIYTFCKL